MANTFIFDDEEEQQPATETLQEYPTDEVNDEEDGEEEEGEGSNRTFLIVAIVLGVIILLALICGTVFAFTVFIPSQNAARATETEQVMQAFSMTQAVEQQTAIVQSFTATPTMTETPLPEPTATPLIMPFPTETQPAPAIDPATATVQALETRLAQVNETATAQAILGPGTATPTGRAGIASPTALSNTGFADEVGLPGLFIAAVVLLAVILLARRLRQPPLAR